MENYSVGKGEEDIKHTQNGMQVWEELVFIFISNRQNFSVTVCLESVLSKSPLL